MRRVKRILRALTRNPRTSAAGIASLFAFGFAARHDPAILAEPGAWIAVITALGLLLAADSNDTPGGGATGGPEPGSIDRLFPKGLRCV